jgi:hypothetical protein
VTRFNVIVRDKVKGRFGNRKPIIDVLVMSLILAPLGCEEAADLGVPSESDAEEYYSASELSVRVSGNVVELLVDQPLRQVRRGGSLWVKVGPYIYLFTDETENLLRAYPGLAGVRVITRTDFDKKEVARAFLHRESLNELTWKRARNIAGRARAEGTRRPVLLEDLVEWGQEHTDFGYSEEFLG